MKKREIARSKNVLEFKGKIEKEAKCLPISMKQIIIAVVFLTFILPINKQAFADKKIKPGRKQATLILSDGRKIILSTSSDTIVNSKTTDVHIKIDSTGINYMIIEKKKESSPAKSKLIEKK
jgi:hypothetical protein